MPEHHPSVAPPAKNAGNIVRWIALFPVSLFGSSVATFAATRLAELISDAAGLSHHAALGSIQAIGLVTGAASFVLFGAWIAPRPKRKAIWALFWVIGVLEILIELFRTPLEYEPMPHSIHIALGVFGAVCGLMLALWWDRKPRSTRPDLPNAESLIEPRNPW